MTEHDEWAGPRSEATGVVLAGGRSTRMGRDKAALLLGGEPLVRRVVERLRRALAEVIVAGPPEVGALVPGVRVVPDLQAGQGPLAGIGAAMRAIQTPWAFVVACDMPFVEPALVRAMLALALTPPQVDALVPRSVRGTEQLHALYARTCLPALESQLAAGDLALHHMLDILRVREMPWSEAARYDPAGLSAFNMNTPEEWERAQAIFHQRSSDC